MPGSIKALRLANLLFGNGLSGAQLSAELAVPASLGSMRGLLAQRSLRQRLLADPTALAIVHASVAGLGLLLEHPETHTGVLASPTAMATLAGNTPLMQWLIAQPTLLADAWASAVARAAFHASDTALAAISANATAKAAARATPSYQLASIGNASSTNPQAVPAITGPVILIGWSLNNTGNVTLTGRRAGSAVGTLGPADPGADGNTAANDNVMALVNPTTVATSTNTSRTTYLGFVPVA